jgi:hypothetical protein
VPPLLLPEITTKSAPTTPAVAKFSRISRENHARRPFRGNIA